MANNPLLPQKTGLERIKEAFEPKETPQEVLKRVQQEAAQKNAENERRRPNKKTVHPSSRDYYAPGDEYSPALEHRKETGLPGFGGQSNRDLEYYMKMHDLLKYGKSYDIKAMGRDRDRNAFKAALTADRKGLRLDFAYDQIVKMAMDKFGDDWDNVLVDIGFKNISNANMLKLHASGGTNPMGVEVPWQNKYLPFTAQPAEIIRQQEEALANPNRLAAQQFERAPNPAFSNQELDQAGVQGKFTRAYIKDNPDLQDQGDYKNWFARTGMEAVNYLQAIFNPATTGRMMTGTSYDELSDTGKVWNVVGDFVPQVVAAMATGGMSAPSWLSKAPFLTRFVTLDAFMDMPDWVQSVEREGLTQGSLDFGNAMVQQFNPAVFFNKDADIGQKTITALTLATAGIGGAHDHVMKSAANKIDKALRASELTIEDYKAAGGYDSLSIFWKRKVSEATEKIWKQLPSEWKAEQKTRDQVEGVIRDVMGMQAFVMNEAYGNSNKAGKQMVDAVPSRYQMEMALQDAFELGRDIFNQPAFGNVMAPPVQTEATVTKPPVVEPASEAPPVTPPVQPDEQKETPSNPNVMDPGDVTVGDQGEVAIPMRELPPPDYRSENPNTIYSVELDPSTIKVDPIVQHKAGTDNATRTTGQFKDIDMFDVDQAGHVLVWQRTNGDLIIAHGHHRLELANRASQFGRIGQGGQVVELPRMIAADVIREADGWTLEDVRRKAAIENLRNGDGSALDAALVLRELGLSPDNLKELGIGSGKALMRDTQGLMNLSDEAIEMIRHNPELERVAAGVGSITELAQEAQAHTIKRAWDVGGRTYHDGRIMANNIRSDLEFKVGDQMGMFGDEVVIQDTLNEQFALEKEVRQSIANNWTRLKNEVKFETRDGEIIDVDARKKELDQMGTRAGLSEKMDFVFDRFDDIKELKRQLASQVKNGQITNAEAAKQLQTAVVNSLGASTSEFVHGRTADGSPRQAQVVSEARGETGSAVETETPAVEIDTETIGMFDDEPSAMPASTQTVQKPPVQPKYTASQMPISEPTVAEAYNNAPNKEAIDAEAQQSAQMLQERNAAINDDDPQYRNDHELRDKNRVKSEPDTTKKTMLSVLDIMRRFDDKMGTTTRFGTKARGSLGTYFPQIMVKMVDVNSGIFTWAHELGHEIQGHFAIWKHRNAPYAMRELLQFEFQQTVTNTQDLGHMISEGWAEFVLAYLRSPEGVRQIAPNAVQVLEETLPPKILEALNEAGADLRIIEGYRGLDQIIANVQFSGKEANTPVSQKLRNFWGSLFGFYGLDGKYRTSKVTELRAGAGDDVMRPIEQAALALFEERGLYGDNSPRRQKSKFRELPDRLRPTRNPLIWLRKLPYLVNMTNSALHDGVFDLITGQKVGPSYVDLIKKLTGDNPAHFERNRNLMVAVMIAERLGERNINSQKIANRILAEDIEAFQESQANRLESEIARLHKQAADAIELQLDAIYMQNKDANLMEARKELEDYWAAKIEEQTKKVDEALHKELALFEVERQEQLLRETAQKIDESFPDAVGHGTMVTQREAIRDFNRLPAHEQKMLREAAAMYRKIGDWIMDTHYQSGLMSSEDYVRVKASNEQWISMMRVMETDAMQMFSGVTKINDPQSQVKQMMGSRRIIKDPMESLAMLIHKTIDNSTRNMMLNSLADLTINKGNMEGRGSGETTNDIMYPIPTEYGVKEKDSAHVVTFKRQGKEKSYFVADPLLANLLREASNNRSPNAATAHAIDLLAGLTSVFRSSITTWPAYTVRNILRDTITQNISSPYVSIFNPFKTKFGSVKNGWSHYRKAMTDPELRRKYGALGMGIGQTKYTTYGERADKTTQQRVYKDIYGSTGEGKNKFIEFRDWWFDTIEKGESFNRIKVFQDARDHALANGLQAHDADQYGAYVARFLMTDFKRGSSLGKSMNKIAPFLNAQVQSQYATLQMMQNDPGNFVSKLMVMTMVGWAFEQGWAQSTDSEDELKEFSPQMRTMYYFYKIGDNKWITVPKGHDTAVMMRLVEATAERLNGDKYAMDGLLASSANILTIAPDELQGPVLKTLSEIRSNKNTFTGNDIVPKYEQNLDLALRKESAQERTVEPFSSLHGVLGMDARQWQHFAGNLSGYYGRAFQQTMGAAEGKTGSAGLLRTITGVTNQSPGYGGKSNQWMIDEAARLGVTIPKNHPIKMAQNKLFEARTDADRQKQSDELIKLITAFRKRLGDTYDSLPVEKQKERFKARL